MKINILLIKNLFITSVRNFGKKWRVNRTILFEKFKLYNNYVFIKSNLRLYCFLNIWKFFKMSLVCCVLKLPIRLVLGRFTITSFWDGPELWGHDPLEWGPTDSTPFTVAHDRGETVHTQWELSRLQGFEKYKPI